MTSSSIVVRPATHRDVEALSPFDSNPSVKAVCFERDGEVIGLGGAAFIEGRWLAFFTPTDELRPHKITIARAAIRFFDKMRKDGVRYIYADRDTGEPTSERWLQSLGFELDPKSRYFYRWRA